MKKDLVVSLGLESPTWIFKAFVQGFEVVCCTNCTKFIALHTPRAKIQGKIQRVCYSNVSRHQQLSLPLSTFDSLCTSEMMFSLVTTHALLIDWGCFQWSAMQNLAFWKNRVLWWYNPKCVFKTTRMDPPFIRGSLFTRRCHWHCLWRIVEIDWSYSDSDGVLCMKGVWWISPTYHPFDLARLNRWQVFLWNLVQGMLNWGLWMPWVNQHHRKMKTLWAERELPDQGEKCTASNPCLHSHMGFLVLQDAPC